MRLRSAVLAATASVLLLVNVPAQAAELGSVEVVASAPAHVIDHAVVGDRMYLAASASHEVPETLWAFDGAAFSQVTGSPLGVGQLYSAGGALYFGDELGSLWSYDGVVLTNFAEVTGVDFVAEFPDIGGIVFSAFQANGTQKLYSLVNGAISEIPSQLKYMAGMTYWEGKVYISGSDGTGHRVYVLDPLGTVTNVPGAEGPVSGIRAVNGVLYASAGAYLYRIEGGGTGSSLVVSGLGAIGAFFDLGGTLYVSAGAEWARLYSLVGGTPTLVESVPTGVFQSVAIDGLGYIGAYNPGNSGVFDGTTFTSFNLGAHYVGNFLAFQEKVYFMGQVDLGGGNFVLDRTLFAYTPYAAPAAPAEPALAATGTGTSAPLAFAALLLLAGVVAVGIRRRAAR